MEYTIVVGQNIAALRHEKQMKQEELARAVGVSAQAVSKWETGGMPDASLLPKIADIFGVSVDVLFGRDPKASGSLWHTLTEAVGGDDGYSRAFEVCAMLVQALGEEADGSKPEPLIPLGDDCSEMLVEKRNNCGTAKIVVSKVNIPYFLFMPDRTEQRAELYDCAGLPVLFADLADKAFWKALIFLANRASNQAFTINLFKNKLGLTEEECRRVIETMCRYSILSKELTEIDEEETIVYKTHIGSSFAAMIRFARDLLPPEKTE
ncbi:MAG: helix-turn-helix transcriptional regulator [Clostridia bacterium]|nr:helix-turn-helix transcriptional regulator [Clostridia bacterium]